MIFDYIFLLCENGSKKKKKNVKNIIIIYILHDKKL